MSNGSTIDSKCNKLPFSWSGLPHGTRHCHLLDECGRDALGMTLTYEVMRWLGALPKIPNLTAQRYERLCGRAAPRMPPWPYGQLGAYQICQLKQPGSWILFEIPKCCTTALWSLSRSSREAADGSQELWPGGAGMMWSCSCLRITSLRGRHGLSPSVRR